jgi:hypothetical protein
VVFSALLLLSYISLGEVKYSIYTTRSMGMYCTALMYHWDGELREDCVESGLERLLLSSKRRVNQGWEQR